MNKHVMLAIMLFLGTFTVWAEDSIRVSAADLHALLERVERLEQAQKHTNKLGYDSIDAVSGASKPMPKDTVTDQPPTTNDHQRRFYIGGYGEVTAKHCWFSNSYLRYGKNPEKYANDHFGEFDLPHVVIYLGYDFGRGWSVSTEIEFEHGGTESAVEIEEEEGGEYEAEIERGGEASSPSCPPPGTKYR